MIFKTCILFKKHIIPTQTSTIDVLLEDEVFDGCSRLKTLLVAVIGGSRSLVGFMAV